MKLSDIPRYAKSVAAAITAGGAALGTGLADGQMTAVEWIAVGTAVIGSLGIVWAVPNKVVPDVPEVAPAQDLV